MCYHCSGNDRGVIHERVAGRRPRTPPNIGPKHISGHHWPAPGYGRLVQIEGRWFLAVGFGLLRQPVHLVTML